MSGLDVLHKLREESPQLPVLLLTAKDRWKTASPG